MFWRILRRQIFANRGRLLVVLLALAAGAAITAALLNLQVDAKQRLTTEFRAFGANVVVTSAQAGSAKDGVDLSLLEALPSTNGGETVYKGAFVYTVGTVFTQMVPQRAVIVGTGIQDEDFFKIIPGVTLRSFPVPMSDVITCRVGERIAHQLRFDVGTIVDFGVQRCWLAEIDRFGGPEDDQIFTSLGLANRIKRPETADPTEWGWPDYSAPKRVDTLLLNVPGSPKSVDAYITRLGLQFPVLSIRPVRQFSEVQRKIYSKINGLLTATVVLVLILTALCVLAAMTNVAMERRNDVGLMKAIGGAPRRVARLFLTEAAVLGLAGGLIGAAVGIFLSMELGKAVFGVAARPRLIVYPIAVGLTVLVAIISAYPLRRLAAVRPASVFRGEA